MDHLTPTGHCQARIRRYHVSWTNDDNTLPRIHDTSAHNRLIICQFPSKVCFAMSSEVADFTEETSNLEFYVVRSCLQEK
jgi:hypothetical protein